MNGGLSYRLTPRWTGMRKHPEQERLWKDMQARFRVNPAGRRSGKTEIAKRRLVKTALNCLYPEPPEWEDPRFFAAAPTRDQAKRIYWSDLKALTPKEFVYEISEGELVIRLRNGASLHVLGMDKPERIEGTPWDGGILDEFGNMKKKTWYEHVRPALSDRRGWCDLIGVPEGRNHYYDIAKAAQADDSGEWGYFWWISADILPPSEIEAAKRDLDELTYLQEYEASFINFSGRVYYGYLDTRNNARITYNPVDPLIFCLDFNVAPGVAAVVQEKRVRDLASGAYLLNETVSCVIGQVYVPRNSNTPVVCNRLIKDWSDHKGRIDVYGDATGGANKTSGIAGSDWDLAKKILGGHFGDRVHYHIPHQNPPERSRINAVNSRLYTLGGKVRLLVDPSKAPMVVKDFEGVVYLEGGSGEIDKKKTPELTHLSDAIGYYIHKEYPVRASEDRMIEVKM